MKNLLCAIVSICALSLAWATSPCAHATVITLTGGDAADASDSIGYAPKPTVDYAYRITNGGNDQSAIVYKGVTFQPFNMPNTFPLSYTNGTATITNSFYYPAGAGQNIGSGGGSLSSDDLALWNIAKYQSYPAANHGTETLTLGGLVWGQTYQVDLFTANSYGGSEYIFTMTGNSGALPSDDTIPINARVAGIAYNVRKLVVADSSGNITVTVTDNGALALDNATINAFSVTEQLPEPAGALTLGFGGAMLAMRRRAQRAA